MDFELDPPAGIGPLRRGMTRADALVVLAGWGEPRETLDLLDIMRPSGMSIVAIVGAAGRVDTIELHRPDADATGDSVRYRDVDLFGLRAPEVIDRLREHTPGGRGPGRAGLLRGARSRAGARRAGRVRRHGSPTWRWADAGR